MSEARTDEGDRSGAGAPAVLDTGAGAAVYSPVVLRLYDPIVLGVCSSLIWRCPASELRTHYQAHLTTNHLDVGVGSGYFLDRCTFPAADPRVVLLDLNPSSLAHVSRRVARLHPTAVVHDVLTPITEPLAPFDSIALNFVLHCLPGTMAEKGRSLDVLRSVARPGTTLVGSTILSGGVRTTRPATALMRAYQRRGIFSNRHDDLESLRATLHDHLDDVTVRVRGCVALFAGRF